MYTDQFIEDTECYVMIKEIWIAPEDRYNGNGNKLIGKAMKECFERGEIFLRYYLNSSYDQDFKDYITTLMMTLGFEVVSTTLNGKMFVLGQTP